MSVGRRQDAVQRLDVDRFHEVVVEAGGKSLVDVLGLAVARQRDQGCRR